MKPAIPFASSCRADRITSPPGSYHQVGGVAALINTKLVGLSLSTASTSRMRTMSFSLAILERFERPRRVSPRAEDLDPRRRLGQAGHEANIDTVLEGMDGSR